MNNNNLIDNEIDKASMISSSTSDSSEVDILLALLENQSHSLDKDTLQLGEDKRILKILEKEGEGEKVLFSDIFTKKNRKAKLQKRVVMMTNVAIYNFEESKYQSFKRRIQIKNLSSLTISNIRDQFILHVRDDYDYHFIYPKRSQFISILARIYKQITNNNLSAKIISIDQMESIILTKTNLLEQQSSINNSFSSQGIFITNKIRQLVSKQKIRYQKDGFDLDLTYITNRIIAMGFPSEDLEGFYRNPYPEVYRFFESRHKDHYKVYNLCSERSYNISKFHSRVACFPFDDHNCPTLNQILSFCLDVDEYLRESPLNVVAIHCKAGKGRTGLMISCYLLFSGHKVTAEDSLNFFGSQRTHNSKGVTIPSQNRFVHYFYRFLRDYHVPRTPFTPISLIITQIKLSHAPNFASSPYFKVVHPNSHLEDYDSKQFQPVKHVAKAEKNIIFNANARVQGEFKIFFYDQKLSGSVNLFHFWLHSSLIDNEYICLTKKEIDGAIKDKKNKKYDIDFTLEIIFKFDEEELEEEDLNDEYQNTQDKELFEEKKGIEDINNFTNDPLTKSINRNIGAHSSANTVNHQLIHLHSNNGSLASLNNLVMAYPLGSKSSTSGTSSAPFSSSSSSGPSLASSSFPLDVSGSAVLKSLSTLNNENSQLSDQLSLAALTIARLRNELEMLKSHNGSI